MPFVEVNNDIVNRIMGITDESEVSQVIESIVPLKKKGGKTEIKKKETKKNTNNNIIIYVTMTD